MLLHDTPMPNAIHRKIVVHAKKGGNFDTVRGKWIGFPFLSNPTLFLIAVSYSIFSALEYNFSLLEYEFLRMTLTPSYNGVGVDFVQ